VEPRLEHGPSFASDSPHNGILCVVLALIGVLTLPHVRCATCRASIQRILTGQQRSLVLQPAYNYKHAKMYVLCPYIKLTLEDQMRPRPLDRIGKNIFIGGTG
jgi:hypothetical protein